MAENMNNEASSCLVTVVSPFKPFSIIIILVTQVSILCEILPTEFVNYSHHAIRAAWQGNHAWCNRQIVT